MESVSLAVEDIVDLLRAEGSDVTDVEAKAARHGYPQDLAPTLSAFGNMPGGGVVVVRTADGRRVVEGIGSGIFAVRQALNQAGMTPPHFIDAGIRFTAIVPDHALLDRDDLDWLAVLPGARGLTDTQRHVLFLMRHGTSWTNRSLRDRFPMDSTKARALLTDLVERQLARPQGDRRGRTYRLGPAATSANPHVTEATGRTKNSDTILDILADGPLGINAIAEASTLSERQVRYAVARLRDAGKIEQLGGAGRPGTVYRRTDRGSR